MKKLFGTHAPPVPAHQASHGGRPHACGSGARLLILLALAPRALRAATTAVWFACHGHVPTVSQPRGFHSTKTSHQDDQFGG